MNNIMKLFVGIFIILTMSACSNMKKVQPVTVENRIESITIFHPPLPSKLSLTWNKDAWVVLTPDILEKHVDAYRKGDVEPLVLYGIPVKDYELLAEGIAKLKKYIKDQKEIIIYYRSLQ